MPSDGSAGNWLVHLVYVQAGARRRRMFPAHCGGVSCFLVKPLNVQIEYIAAFAVKWMRRESTQDDSSYRSDPGLNAETHETSNAGSRGEMALHGKEALY